MFSTRIIVAHVWPRLAAAGICSARIRRLHTDGSRYRSWSFNLKTAFHAFKLHAKVASSIPFLPFIPRFLPALLSPDFFSAPPRYDFARFLHSSSFEPSEKGSFESLLSFLVFHGLMLPDQRFVGRIRIYLGTSRDASGDMCNKKRKRGNNERKINASGGKSAEVEKYIAK